MLQFEVAEQLAPELGMEVLDCLETLSGDLRELIDGDPGIATELAQNKRKDVIKKLTAAVLKRRQVGHAA